MEAQNDISSLCLEDLQEEYYHLSQRYQQLQDINEENAQRIHELKRSLDTATAAEAYLAQELEQLTVASSESLTPDSKSSRKPQAELSELRRKYNNLENELALLQSNYDNTLLDNAKLQQKLEHLVVQRTQTPEILQANTEEIACIQALEQQNMSLLEKLQELEENSARSTLQLAEHQRKIEMLEDEVTCLKENLQFKRAELDEKTQLLESVQDQLAEVNAQLAALSQAPENADRKGNSLFAEVDDQRQAMKQMLAAQKKSYIQMKKIFNESEYEIRRLKRENAAMHKEMQTCVSIFCDADKVYQKKLKARIKDLVDENEQLQRKLKLSEQHVREVAAGKGVSCIESMLKFCKRETEELKQQLRSERIEKASLEEQQRSSQQNLSRWRFEALKTRCILLDRENLLQEQKIAFKPQQQLEIQISQQQLETAQPRLVTTSEVNFASNTAVTIEAVKLKQEVVTDCTVVSLSANLKNMAICELSNIDDENKENLLPNALLKQQPQDPKPIIRFANSPLKCHNVVANAADNVVPQTKSAEKTKSMLTQEVHLVAEQPTNRQVSFASHERQVHILSPNEANDSAIANNKPNKITKSVSSNGVVIRRFLFQRK